MSMPDVFGCGLLCSQTIESFKERAILLLPICPIVSILGTILATGLSIIVLTLFAVTHGAEHLSCILLNLWSLLLFWSNLEFPSCAAVTGGFVKRSRGANPAVGHCLDAWAVGCVWWALHVPVSFPWYCTLPAAVIKGNNMQIIFEIL